MINILLSRSDLINPYIKPQLTPYIKHGMTVTVIAYSFFEEQYHSKEAYDADYQQGGKYYLKVVEQLIPFGIKETDILWVHYFNDTKEEAIQKIKQADILFFPGGAPEKFMARIIDKGLEESINQHKKTYIGVSAGTMIQFKHYYISKDVDYHAFSYQEGLDLLSGFYVEVHFRRRIKQKSSMRRVFRTYRQPVYVIPDDGCLIIDKGTIIPVHTAHKYYEKRGIVK